jgi:hypothetical protein
MSVSDFFLIFMIKSLPYTITSQRSSSFAWSAHLGTYLAVVTLLVFPEDSTQQVKRDADDVAKSERQGMCHDIIV